MNEPKEQSNIDFASNLFIDEEGYLCYWQTSTLDLHGTTIVMSVKKNIEDETNG